jgi:hypothetical protein
MCWDDFRLLQKIMYTSGVKGQMQAVGSKGALSILMCWEGGESHEEVQR